jgi:hypothetical protein
MVIHANGWDGFVGGPESRESQGTVKTGDRSLWGSNLEGIRRLVEPWGNLDVFGIG